MEDGQDNIVRMVGSSVQGRVTRNLFESRSR